MSQELFRIVKLIKTTSIFILLVGLIAVLLIEMWGWTNDYKWMSMILIVISAVLALSSSIALEVIRQEK